MRLRSLLPLVLPLALLVRPAPGQDVFALRLASSLAAVESGNWVCSPWGFAESLGMLSAGADADVARELRETITPPGVEDVPGYFAGHRADWLAMGGGSEALKVGIANSAWLPQGAAVPDDETLRVWREAYGADVRMVDFGDPGAVAEAAGDWLESENGGLAGGIAPESIPAGASLLLLGTVSFSGDWLRAFEEEDTVEEPFHNADGTETVVPMMHDFEIFNWRWGRRPEGEVLALPYAGEELEFRVWLPSPGVSLSRLLESIAADWKRWERALKTTAVDLALPRFDVEWSSPDLRGVFAGLGMGSPWAPGASFPGFGGAGNPEIRQHVVFDVDEFGTRAAAVTRGMVYACGAEPVVFRVDRPFVFAVVEPAEGNILFIGQYVHAGVGEPEATAEPDENDEIAETAESETPEPLENPAAETPQED